jgi:aspartokinase
MSLDIKRLRADASKLQDELSKSPSSRETTGTTKAIRAALPEIYKLREQGMKWSVIAAAMAAQGIVQDKERAPLTTNRLTALVRQIELQNERRNAKRARKAAITASPKKIAMQN